MSPWSVQNVPILPVQHLQNEQRPLKHVCRAGSTRRGARCLMATMQVLSATAAKYSVFPVPLKTAPDNPLGPPPRVVNSRIVRPNPTSIGDPPSRCQRSHRIFQLMTRGDTPKFGGTHIRILCLRSEHLRATSMKSSCCTRNVSYPKSSPRGAS